MLDAFRVLENCSGPFYRSFLCELCVPLVIRVHTGDSGTNRSPLLIPLNGLMWINFPRANLILVLYVQGHFLRWLLNMDKVSSRIDGPKWPRKYFIKCKTWLKLRKYVLIRVRVQRIGNTDSFNQMLWSNKD